MESSTSYTERYIIISNSIIRNIGALGGPDVFRLYIELLLQKNWRNEVFMTPSLLIKKLGRSEQYWRKQIKSQLQTLVDKKMISLDATIKDMGVNDYMEINLTLRHGSATDIKCINNKILTLQSPVGVNTLFAVFVFIKMCVDRNKDIRYARVSMKKIANGIGINEKTVENAIKVLQENGFLGVKRGIYDKVSTQKECNKYYIYDYNSLMYRAKHGLVSFPEKQAISESQEAEVNIEKKIAEVLTNPVSFSPCVFKGLPAMIFKEHCGTLGYENLFIITALKDIEEIMEEYGGILGGAGDLIILCTERLTDGIEDYIVEFIKISELPIVLLLSDEVEISNNQLKSQIRYIFS